MIQPNDVMNVDKKDWDEFKKRAVKDELFYDGEGDLLDTPEGRAKFCRLNSGTVYQKPDPNFPGYKIWVFNLQGKGIMIKRRSTVDPALMVTVSYDENGIEIDKAYEPA